MISGHVYSMAALGFARGSDVSSESDEPSSGSTNTARGPYYASSVAVSMRTSQMEAGEAARARATEVYSSQFVTPEARD